MARVYLLTIVDQADFGQTVHHSAWDTRAGASEHAHDVVLPRIKTGVEPEFHDALEVEIVQMEINDASS